MTGYALRYVRRYAAAAVGLLACLADRFLPTSRSLVVVRSSTVHDDQARETVAALNALDVRPVWLVNDGEHGEAPHRGVATVLPAGSLRGLAAYLRAGVVLHTHGVSFGSKQRSRRKVFVNLWHGMPIKRLESDTPVALLQTDITFATSRLHRDNLAATWSSATVHETGLPRNDVLVRPASPAAPIGNGRPLVLWLPTFRRVPRIFQKTGSRMAAVDGVDEGNAAQFPGASPQALGALADELGVTLVVKPHPMAAGATPADPPDHVRYWTDRDLVEHGLTLYELLAATDVLITDYSSVWIDFLLTGRPIVFAAADMAQYAASRGFYFDVTRGLPGPVATDLDGLTAAIREAVHDPDRWTVERRDALDVHHRHHDAGSAARVAQVVLNIVAGSGSGIESAVVSSERNGDRSERR